MEDLAYAGSVLRGTNSIHLHKNKGCYYNFLNEETETGRALIILPRVAKIIIGKIGI